MNTSIYAYIIKHSLRQQVVALVLTAASFPFLYYTLELPKIIINRAIGGTDFPKDIYGIAFEQIPYLAALCGVYLVLVLINGAFKYYVNVFKGLLGERMLRRLRYELYCRVLRFPLPTFRKMSQGEIIPMITSEVEPLGGFIGDSLALPLFQGGTLLTILFFLFVQNWVMGLAAISLYPLQIYVIPKLQRRVNLLGKERVRLLRRLSDRIGETVSGVEEIHSLGTARYELAVFSERMGHIFDVRYLIYRKKFFIKFLNNFLAQLGPFFFFSIGGYLVIQGSLTFGALVAALSAYKELYAPWKELLAYYQLQADASIKFEQVVTQFDPAGLRDEKQLVADVAADALPSGDLAASNVTLTDDNQISVVDGVSVRLGPEEHVAIVGRAGSGKEEFMQLLARLLDPTSGRVSLGGTDLAQLTEPALGRSLVYVGPSTFLFAGTLGDNIVYPLKLRPAAPPEGDRAAQVAEAMRAGNSPDDARANWVDHTLAGVAASEALTGAVIGALKATEMDEDVFQFGLRGTIDPARRADVAERILKARAEMSERLADPAFAPLVERFDRDRYNTNSTLGENLLFGTPVGDAFDMEHLAENAYVLSVLETVGLKDDLVRMGREVAATMVELFADLPPEHELFQQFSFISADDLPDYQSLVARADKGNLANLRADDRTRLMSLPFRLVPTRHRLGLIDDAMQARLLDARHAFAANLPDDLKGAVEFFDPETYNAATSIQDNILFGKLAYGHAEGAARVGELIADVIDVLDLRETVTTIGLDFNVGIAGARLGAAQRQKVAIARALLKRPRYLLLADATAPLDIGAQPRVIRNVLDVCRGRGVYWSHPRARLAEGFERVLVFRGGRLADSGTFAELAERDGPLKELLEAE